MSVHNQETYPFNANYGLSYQLKRYAGYPYSHPLNAYLVHGLYDTTEVDPAEKQHVPFNKVLNWQRSHDSVYRDFGWEVVDIAAPFYYTMAMVPLAANPEKRGTLFFPQHSTAGKKYGVDFAALAQTLLALPDEFHPITICKHWYDRSQGYYAPFDRMGFDSVTCGGFMDNEFLDNLCLFMSRSKYTGSNWGGTTAAYSTMMDVPHFVVEGEFQTRPSLGGPIASSFNSLFSLKDFEGRVKEEQKEKIEYMCKKDCFESQISLFNKLNAL